MKIVLIGAGNVGYHLGLRLYELNIEIVQVYSRTIERAQFLADLVQAKSCVDLSKLDKTADLYIIAVHDGVIGSVAEQLQFLDTEKRLVVHTSGATPSTVLQPFFRRYGVFYPLQSFSILRPIDFSQVPICVDAVADKDQLFLQALATKLSTKVYEINDKERAILHVAAVFVNNFTNHLLYISESILERENISFDILKPLLQETIAKIEDHSAKDMQTGPAIRGDQATLDRHLVYLEGFPDYRMIYSLLSKAITVEHRKHT